MVVSMITHHVVYGETGRDSKWLSIKITLDTYSHCIPGMQDGCDGTA